MARVVGAGDRGGARVECHCYCEDLEDRTKFVDAKGVSIEHPVGKGNGGMLWIRSGGMVRIEIGKRCHRQDLATVDVHNQASATFRGEIVDDALQFLVEDVLQAKVER